jgi:hypothetical protein
MKRIILAILIIPALTIKAQDKKDEPKFGINFNGFVKTDVFYDTRQTVNIREGHFLLYPENIANDANGEDINAKPAFNILSIQTRLKGVITAPDAFGAKTSGIIEADFFGNAGSGLDDVNGFRLRHAFVKLSWAKTELLAGQYWHPMFVAESFPGVISFNTGAPFQPFTRNPQLRLSHTIGGLKLIGVLFAQRDFASMGPDYSLQNGKYSSSTITSSRFMRNAGIPNLHFQLQYTPKSTGHLVGAGVDYKTIQPELFTVNAAAFKRFGSSEKLGSLSALAFAKLKFKPLTVQVTGIYAQNAADMVMLGGYAVSQVSDTATGAKKFTNLNTGSFWLDAITTGKKVQFGLFTGYTMNMGSADDVKTATYYSRGSNIDHILRVSPRVVFISGKLDIAFELEHTLAAYGKITPDTKSELTDLQTVSNTRALLAFIFKF